MDLNILTRKLSYLLIIGLGGLPLAAALGVSLVVPNANALVEGDGNNGAPFLDSQSEHYQQVYSASQFGLLATNGGRIDRISFRYHGNYNTATIIYNSMRVTLSTTTNAVDNLSTNFASNLGPDSVVVFSGKYTLPPTPFPTDHQLHSWPFPMTIPFSTPFNYNPTNGNLLLDIQWPYADTYAGNGPPWPDAVYASGDSLSRVWAENIYITYIPTNGTVASIGLVTLFGISPTVAPMPRFTNSTVSGTNLVLSGVGGAPGAVYSVLASTNLATPLANWTSLTTNAFDSNGAFTLTNQIVPDLPFQFYTVQIQ
jgi:hypothetical protein